MYILQWISPLFLSIFLFRLAEKSDWKINLEKGNISLLEKMRLSNIIWLNTENQNAWFNWTYFFYFLFWSINWRTENVLNGIVFGQFLRVWIDCFHEKVKYLFNHVSIEFSLISISSIRFIPSIKQTSFYRFFSYIFILISERY